MPRPRNKGMMKGRLKKFSSQTINAGRYSPHKPTLAELSRRPRSLGNVDPKTLNITQPQVLPRTIGATQPMKERTATWEMFVRNERHHIKPDEVKIAKEIKTMKSLWRLCWVTNRGWWFWFHKDITTGVMRRSIIYATAKRAEAVFVDRITWSVTE